MYYEEHRCKEHEEDADAVARYGIADVVDSTGISAMRVFSGLGAGSPWRSVFLANRYCPIALC